MFYDYCIHKAIIIDYIDQSGKSKTMCINQKQETKMMKQYNSCRKYVKQLEKKCEKYSYEKILYENMSWTSEKYQFKYETILRRWYPCIKEFIKVYKISVAKPCH
jgi:hypothetical protein